jgi:hypothetical protein
MALELFMDETVSGATTTELGATLAFVDGESYLFTSIMEADGATDSRFGWVLNGESTGTNYEIDERIRTAGTTAGQADTAQEDATFSAITAGFTQADGAQVVSRLRVTVTGTALHCEFEHNRITSAATSTRFMMGKFIFDNGSTLPTTLGVLCDRTGMAVGSNIKGVKLT